MKPGVALTILIIGILVLVGGATMVSPPLAGIAVCLVGLAIIAWALIDTDRQLELE